MEMKFAQRKLLSRNKMFATYSKFYFILVL